MYRYFMAGKPKPPLSMQTRVAFYKLLEVLSNNSTIFTVHKTKASNQARVLPAWHFSRVYPNGELFRQTQIFIINTTLFASTVNYGVPQLGLVHPQTPKEQKGKSISIQYFPLTHHHHHHHHDPSPESLSFAWFLRVPVAFIGLKKDRHKSHRKLLPAWALQLAMFLCQSCHKENRSSNFFLHLLETQVSFTLKL